MVSFDPALTCIIEPTVSWDSSVEEASKHKKLMYMELAANKGAEKGSQWQWWRERTPPGPSSELKASSGEPGMLGFTAEPSRGVMGLSAEHPIRWATTW